MIDSNATSMPLELLDLYLGAAGQRLAHPVSRAADLADGVCCLGRVELVERGSEVSTSPPCDQAKIALYGELAVKGWPAPREVRRSRSAA
jgi:hypothetical protein